MTAFRRWKSDLVVGGGVNWGVDRCVDRGVDRGVKRAHNVKGQGY